jgi:nucleotide-binding universal stress UspA family protein
VPCSRTSGPATLVEPLARGHIVNEVLIGVDGSEDSRSALQWGAGIAERLGASIHVMRAWQYPSDAILSIGRLELPPPDKAAARIEAELRVLLEETLGQRAEQATVEVARGPAAGVLLHAAESHPRMVVVGSRGLGGFKGLMLGSVGRQLAEHVTCPVTVVRPGAPAAPFRLETIVTAHDGSPNASHAMDVAAAIATQLGAQLVVASAAPPAAGERRGGVESRTNLSERREQLETWCAPLRDAGVEHHIAVVEGDARTALLDVVRDRYADLLVVGSRGRGPVAKLLLGSVASSLAQHSEQPVMIVPQPR